MKNIHAYLPFNIYGLEQSRGYEMKCIYVYKNNNERHLNIII